MDPYVALFDRQGQVVWLSHAPAQMAGEPAIGKPAWHWSQGEERDTIKTLVSRCLVFNEEQRFQTSLHFKGGPATFSVRMLPLPFKEVGAIAIGIELSQSASLLTKREAEVLGLMAKGLGTKQIALRLDMATSTVGTHIGNAKSKLHIWNKEALIAWAVNSLP